MLIVKDKSGQSLLEVILAMAIFSLIAAAMAALITGNFGSLTQGGEQTEAEALAQEGIEAVKSIRDGAWNELILSQSGVDIISNEWVFDGETTTDTIGQFTRTISFIDVCRDSSDDIVDCPGSYTDVHTKLVTSSVVWTIREGITNSVQRVAYLTNWDSKNWTQSDWSGGDEQSTWLIINKYDSDDGNLVESTAGQLTLLAGELTDTGFSIDAGSSNNDWPFTTAGNYTYDSDDIEVAAGVAQLISGPATLSGDTVNPSFDVDASNWTYSDWEEDGGRVSGTHQATGGNPNGYIDVSIDKTKNATLSGFWEQAFTTTADNPSTATVDLDWIVSQYDGSFITSFQLYAFVDSSSGNPTAGQQVWSSGEISTTTSWASISTVDVSSKLGAAGTYYLKIAARIITGGGGGPASGTNIAGFDNVSLHWEGSGTSYPIDEPDIYPTTSFTVSGPGTWVSFAETATKNGGEIYYQLSDDDASTWQYWNGSSWISAGTSDYNPATVVNTNISTFNAGNEKIRFRAFLESDGQQQVQLDNINIAFTESGSPWSFATWGVDGGEETPTGIHQGSGGNPDGYNDVTVQNGNNDIVGGVWTQSFTNYRASPTPVTLDFDYKVIDYNGIPDVAHIRVYVDTASGDPVTQVGSSVSISGEGSWTAASQYDLSSAVSATGTYYLKIVFYVETGPAGGSGPFTVGFDNAVLDLGNGAHPTSGTLTSSAYGMSAASKVQVVEWNETVPEECSCSIKLQIQTAPDSSGSPGAWSDYWQGPDGEDSDATDFFTTAAGELVHTDMNDDQWVRYLATFAGDGTDTPVLTEMRINYK